MKNQSGEDLSWCNIYIYIYIYISDTHTNWKSNNLLTMLQYLHPSLFIHEVNCEFLVKVLRYVAMARAIPILNLSGKR